MKIDNLVKKIVLVDVDPDPTKEYGRLMDNYTETDNELVIETLTEYANKICKEGNFRRFYINNKLIYG